MDSKTGTVIDNELIAQFLGWKCYEPDANWNLPRWCEPDPTDLRKKGKFKGYPEQLKFDTSWDWLMPVCVKLGMKEVNTDINTAYQNVINEIRNRNLG